MWECSLIKISYIRKNKKLVADIGHGNLSTIQIQTAVFQSSGNLLSLSATINSITDDYSNDITNDYEFDDVFEGRRSGVNCTELMIKDCNWNKYNFMLLRNSKIYDGICMGNP